MKVVSDAAQRGLVVISRGIIANCFSVRSLSAETMLELVSTGVVNNLGVPTEDGLRVLREVDFNLYVLMSCYLIRGRLYSFTNTVLVPLDPSAILAEAEASHAKYVRRLQGLEQVLEELRTLLSDHELVCVDTDEGGSRS